jgi:ABC-2 type transport system ATP-binding protein
MDHGRILALDTPKALKATVKADTILTIKASGDQAAFAALLERELAGVTLVREVDGAVEAHVQGGSGLVPRVVRIAESHGYEVGDLSLTEPTLETVFINFTGKDLRD